MKFLVISKLPSVTKDLRDLTCNREVTIVEATTPDQAVTYLSGEDDFRLVIVSMASVWGGSQKWDRVIDACGKRQTCIFVPDTCEINAISGVILNNQVVCPLHTPVGKKMLSMLVNGLLQNYQAKQAPLDFKPVFDASYGENSGNTIKPPRFTRRQKEVLDLMVTGKSNREIARVLNVAEGTIKLHSLSIYRSLGVSSRVQAVLQGQKLASAATRSQN